MKILNNSSPVPAAEECETLTDFVYASLLQLAPAIDFSVRLSPLQDFKTQTDRFPQRMSGFDMLAYDLFTIGVSLAYADQNVAREESVLLSGLGHIVRTLASRPFVELNMAAFIDVKKHDNWYLPLVCMDPIVQYDFMFEAKQADALRLLYYRFGQEMVVADGQIVAEERMRLAELKSLLDPHSELELLALTVMEDLRLSEPCHDVLLTQARQDEILPSRVPLFR